MLALTNVTKQFGGLTAIQNLSFEVQTGKIQGVIGPNGAGKSTLFNLITGLPHPTSGRIFFEGCEITDHQPYQIARSGIARTFQNIRLLPGMTVLETVMVGQLHRQLSWWKKLRTSEDKDGKHKQGWSQKGEELLEFFDLIPYRDHFAMELPYGLQRRVEIARAMAAIPKLLLLDEPAAGMNERETEQLAEDIARIRAGGCTVVVIEHDMSLIMGLCDQITVLNFGQKIAEGGGEDIRNNALVIEAYLGREEQAIG
ncbi:MAG: ABC transporter ATP-binding protein [Desulfitobacteriaceae bacterium]